MEDMIKPTDRIRQVIDAAGITQSKFARSVGVDSSNFARYMAQGRMPHTTLAKIAGAYDISIRWLEDGEGDMKAERSSVQIGCTDKTEVESVVPDTPAFEPTVASHAALIERVRMLENENAWLRSVVEKIYQSRY